MASGPIPFVKKPKGHRQQIVLFLISVFLPALILTIFAMRIVRQERELFQKRADEERKRVATAIGASLLNRLESLKRHAAIALEADPDAFRGREIFLP